MKMGTIVVLINEGGEVRPQMVPISIRGRVDGLPLHGFQKRIRQTPHARGHLRCISAMDFAVTRQNFPRGNRFLRLTFRQPTVR